MITIRKAIPGDAPLLAPLMLLAMEDIIYYFIGKRDREEAVRFLTYLISSDQNQYSYQHIWIAEDSHTLLGQICLYDGGELESLRKPVLNYLHHHYQQDLQLEDETEAGEIYLDTIAVSADAQGRGIGKKLLQHVITKLAHQDGKTIGLLVDDENPGAKSLYLRSGFKVVSKKNIFGKSMEHLQYAAQNS